MKWITPTHYCFINYSFWILWFCRWYKFSCSSLFSSFVAVLMRSYYCGIGCEFSQLTAVCSIDFTCGADLYKFVSRRTEKHLHLVLSLVVAADISLSSFVDIRLWFWFFRFSFSLFLKKKDQKKDIYKYK